MEERILQLAARKRKLEELVTRHLGRGGGVTDEDVKSSVFHGACQSCSLRFLRWFA